MLLVEDDVLVVRAYNRILRRWVDIAWARSAEEALEILIEPGRCFVGAIVDLLLPGQRGTRVLEALNAQARSLPVLVASGYLTPELEAQAVSLGASTAAKPLLLEELLGFVAAAIAERHGLARPLARAVARFSWEHRLTAREHEIVTLTVAGVTDRAVLATVLGCSSVTAKAHVTEILVKVGATSLLEVAVLVMRRVLSQII